MKDWDEKEFTQALTDADLFANLSVETPDGFEDVSEDYEDLGSVLSNE